MALNGLNCAYVPLRNYSLTHSLTHAETSISDFHQDRPMWIIPSFSSDFVVCISAYAVDCARLRALLLLVKDTCQLQTDDVTSSAKMQNQATEGWFTYWSISLHVFTEFEQVASWHFCAFFGGEADMLKCWGRPDCIPNFYFCLQWFVGKNVSKVNYFCINWGTKISLMYLCLNMLSM